MTDRELKYKVWKLILLYMAHQYAGKLYSEHWVDECFSLIEEIQLKEEELDDMCDMS